MHRQLCLSFNDGLRTLAQTVVENNQTEPLLIAVSGGSCSGKSHFSTLLGEILKTHGTKYTVLELDDYFRNLNDPKLPRGPHGEPLYDVPDSYHRKEIQEHLQALLQGKSVDSPCYELERNKRSLDRTLRKEPASVILVDGLYAIDQISLISAESVLVYVEAAAEVRLQRRLTRDIPRFHVAPAIIERVFWQRIEPAHRKYIEPQKGLADLVVR